MCDIRCANRLEGKEARPEVVLNEARGVIQLRGIRRGNIRILPYVEDHAVAVHLTDLELKEVNAKLIGCQGA